MLLKWFLGMGVKLVKLHLHLELKIALVAIDVNQLVLHVWSCC